MWSRFSNLVISSLRLIKNDLTVVSQDNGFLSLWMCHKLVERMLYVWIMTRKHGCGWGNCTKLSKIEISGGKQDYGSITATQPEHNVITQEENLARANELKTRLKSIMQI